MAQGDGGAREEPCEDLGPAGWVAEDVLRSDVGAVEGHAVLHVAGRGNLTFERHAGRVRVDEKSADRALARGGEDEDPLGGRGGRDARLHAVELPGAAVHARRRGDVRLVVTVRLGERGGEDDPAAGDPRQEARALGVASPAGDGHGAEDERLPERQRRDRGTRLLEKGTHLEQPVTQSAVSLRDGRPEEPGRRERGPRRSVEAVGAGLDGLQRRRPEALIEDLPGEPRDGGLCFGEREVHGCPQRGALGIPRPVVAMMSRCTSFVPPPKVRTIDVL